MHLFVKVKPNSRKEIVKKIDDTHFEIAVKAPPTEGKANAAAIALLARFLRISRSKIRIIRGLKSKQKVFDIF